MSLIIGQFLIGQALFLISLRVGLDLYILYFDYFINEHYLSK
ncbi:Uncharacterised protein [Yersinia aldovae]|nr:Uncharacterised protein [Yersinia aldovae]